LTTLTGSDLTGIATPRSHKQSTETKPIISSHTRHGFRWKPSKKKSIKRIDGIVALIMALDRASTQPPPEKSAYETHGILYV